MTIGKKLAAAFATVIALTIIIGIVGAVNMKNIDTSYTNLYEKNTVSITHLSDVTSLVEEIRVAMYGYIVDAVSGDPAAVETRKQSMDDLQARLTASMDAYKSLTVSAEGLRLFEEARTVYDTQYKPFIEQQYSLAKSLDTQGAIDLLSSAREISLKMTEGFNTAMDVESEEANQVSIDNTDMTNQIVLMVVIILAVVVAVSSILAIKISASISNPLKSMMVFLDHASSTGDVSVNDETRELMARISAKKDEIGGISTSLSAFIMHVVKNAGILNVIAGKDLRSEIVPLSDQDTLGVALKGMNDGLGEMFREIGMASTQVSTGSGQVADAAQSLAQGATEQAATIEELSSAMQEVSDRTRNSAAIARETSELADDIKRKAEASSQQMGDMVTAVNDISEASNEVNKIIKVIDDIAFQTNILALNAAVEAARAGSHGKGFSVVAEEVRNLAAKSADAVKNTEALISDSIVKAQRGVSVAKETSDSLDEIIAGINKSQQLAAQISDEADQQAEGILQINSGIEQVAMVVQQNSATAEESAAASEEMSGQSDMLQEMISQFKTRDN